ncbi:MAG: sugar kinase [Candidatus Omnitrophica bacterium]|nr:sugar kinase [Candidatus Omnitrophota bacterium]
MAIVVVGSVALDTITTSSGIHPDLLGGSATHFSLAARRFADVRLVAAVGQDFPPRLRTILKHPRVDLEGLAVSEGKTFRWHGRYADDFSSRETLGLQLGVFETFRPHIPLSHRRSSTVFLANIDPHLQQAVLSQVDRPRLIAVDTIDHWITHARDALIRLLRRTDMIFLNEEEAHLLTQRRSHRAMGAWLRAHGPSVIILKQGWYGAVGWVDRSMLWVPAYPVDETVDPTGAGDSFAGGVLGVLDRAKRIDVRTLRQAMLCGSVIGSFCVEGMGVSGLQRLPAARFQQRLVALKRISGLIR